MATRETYERVKAMFKAEAEIDEKIELYKALSKQNFDPKVVDKITVDTIFVLPQKFKGKVDSPHCKFNPFVTDKVLVCLKGAINL